MDFEEDVEALAGGGLDKEAHAKILERLFWGDNLSEAGFVPSVNPADLKSVWNMWRDMHKRMPDQQVSLDVELYKNVCSPNTYVPAVYYRASMLQILAHLEQQNMGELPSQPDAVFEVTATFPMPRFPAGVPRQGLPFDVEEFAKQVEQAGRKL